MREVKQGIDDYLAATGDRARGPDRQPPVRRGPPDADARRPALAARAAGRPGGKKIAVSWAYSPSYAKPLSVPQGLVSLLTRFGAHVTLAQPEGYRLMDEPMAAAAANAKASGGSFRTVASMDEAFAGAHAVYPKSWGPWDLMQERVAGEPQGRQGRDGRHREARARAQRPPPRLDLRRAADGPHAGRPLPALPPGRHRRRGEPGRDAALPRGRRARGQQEGVRDHGAPGRGQGGGPARAPREPEGSRPDARSRREGRGPRRPLPSARRLASCARRSASPPTTWTSRSRRAAIRSAASATTRARGWST